MVLNAAVVQDAGPGLRQVNGYFHCSFNALGTTNEIMFQCERHADAKRIAAEAVAWVEHFEATCSWFRPSSELNTVNRGAGSWVEVGPEIEELLTLCDWYHWKTFGAFDPTSGPLHRLWNSRLEAGCLPSDAEIEEARSLVGWIQVERKLRRVRLSRPGMELNLGGIGKEYAVDKVYRMIRSFGVSNLLVNFGQDLRVHGRPPEGGPWKIGLERPDRPGFCWGGSELYAEALCSSGSYYRGTTINGRRYSHILHPGLGIPVDHDCKGFWVCAPTCTEAGVLSTAAFILGREKGLEMIERAGCSGAAWSENGVYMTKGFPISHENDE